MGKLTDWAITRYSAPLVQHAVLGFMRLSGRERRFVRRYLAAPGPKALQIGAGFNRHAGWLHTNWFPIRPWGRKSMFLDATRRFPFADATFDYIFSEHMIEHVPYPSGLAMLRECARVLKPGGRIRLSTPDLRQFARMLGDGLDGPEQEYRDWAIARYVEPGHPASAVSLFNSMVRNWGHTYIFDEQTLRETLAAAGFTEMQRFAVNQSADPFLGTIDHAARFPVGYLEIKSVILEAVKPG